MILFGIMKFIIAEMTIIFDMILKEIFETKAKEIVLKVIKVVVINKAIAKTMTNFLKAFFIYSFRCFF